MTGLKYLGGNKMKHSKNGLENFSFQKKILLGLMIMGVFLLVVSCSKEIPEESVNVPTEESVDAVLATNEIHAIVIENNQFMPRDLDIKAGHTVEWTNKESAEHTVSFENGDLDEFLPSEGRASYTFMEKGEFRYFCKLHSGMQGTISVS
tara:strand:+ start:1061 stop:1510 length:450 start_codon:yes stop_codon:yes gene_type:complete